MMQNVQEKLNAGLSRHSIRRLFSPANWT